MTLQLGEFVMLVQLRLDQVDPAPSGKVSRKHSHQKNVSHQTTSGHQRHLSPRTVAVQSKKSEIRDSNARRLQTAENNKEKNPLPKRRKLDPKALTEATSELNQTLQRIISRAKDLPSGGESQRVGPSGEVQQPMLGPLENDGRGIYGGAFDAPLGAAVLDQGGWPINNTGTIVHILRDLLTCAFKSFGEAKCDKPKGLQKTPAVKPGARQDTVELNPSKKEKEMERDLSKKEEEMEMTRNKVESLRRNIAERRAMRQERNVKSL